MDTKEYVTFETDKYAGVSVTKRRVITIEGNEVTISSLSNSFTPLQFHEAVEFAPSLDAVLTALWTPDVINHWNEFAEQLNKEKGFISL